MNESLMISNVYAAYTATADKSDKKVLELSKLYKKSDAIENNDEDKNDNMDKVILSKEALERLGILSVA